MNYILYIKFTLIILGFILIAKIVYFLFSKYLKKLTKTTKTQIDDLILKIVKTPIYTFLVILGFFIGLSKLQISPTYFIWIKKGFFVIFTLIFTYIISEIIAVLISYTFSVQEKFKRIPKLIIKIVKSSFYIIALLIILDIFQIKITPLLASLGIGGMAVALALQPTLSNIFAGIHIISDKPINVGDYIELENGISGFVEDIGWRSTRIKTIYNNYVVIPNSKFAESIIINQSLPGQELIIKIECGVDYSSDLEKVEKITLEVAKNIQEKIKGAVKEFKPFMRYHTFGDSNINFSVFLKIRSPIDKLKVAHEFIKALKSRYDKENIEISWPVRKIQMFK